MAITSARVAVAATAVALNTASPQGQTLVITNLDGTSGNGADLGISTVAAGAGFFLAGGATITIAVDAGDVLYAIRTTSNSISLSVLRT